jgi:hypothetical protein
MDQAFVNQQLEMLKLQLEDLLNDLLGDFSNGRTAIWKGSVKPVELKTKGLECTIYPVKEGQTFNMSAGQTLADQCWKVELVNYCADPGDPDFGKLAIAKMRIESRFVLRGMAMYQAPSDRRLERCVFNIYAPTVFNPR